MLKKHLLPYALLCAVLLFIGVGFSYLNLKNTPSTVPQEQTAQVSGVDERLGNRANTRRVSTEEIPLSEQSVFKLGLIMANFALRLPKITGIPIVYSVSVVASSNSSQNQLASAGDIAQANTQVKKPKLSQFLLDFLSPDIDPNQKLNKQQIDVYIHNNLKLQLDQVQGISEGRKKGILEHFDKGQTYSTTEAVVDVGRGLFKVATLGFVETKTLDTAAVYLSIFNNTMKDGGIYKETMALLRELYPDGISLNGVDDLASRIDVNGDGDVTPTELKTWLDAQPSSVTRHLKNISDTADKLLEDADKLNSMGMGIDQRLLDKLQELTPVLGKRPTYSCTGNDPDPGKAFECHLKNNTGLKKNTQKVLVQDCSVIHKCEYECDVGLKKKGSKCVPFECTGVVPSNSSPCDPDTGNLGLVDDRPIELKESCIAAPACSYKCNDGFKKKGNKCEPISCVNPIDYSAGPDKPAEKKIVSRGKVKNATLCPGGNEGLTADTESRVTDSCAPTVIGGNKCNYMCNPGYEVDYGRQIKDKDGNRIPVACVKPPSSGGTSSCRFDWSQGRIVCGTPGATGCPPEQTLQWENLTLVCK